jgi:hypothetical protein
MTRSPVRTRPTDVKKARSARHYVNRKEHIKKRVRAHKGALKLEVMSHYSGGRPACRVCGVDDVVKLAVDHIHDGGVVHRRKTGKPGNGMYLWIKKNGFPPLFQILCHNCNQKKHTASSKGVRGHGSEYKRKIKLEVFSTYSGGSLECKGCGEKDVDVLTIDHVNDDGGEHRRSSGLGTGYKMYAWLRKMGFPGGFQVLCFNCNMAKAIRRV